MREGFYVQKKRKREGAGMIGGRERERKGRAACIRERQGRERVESDNRGVCIISIF